MTFDAKGFDPEAILLRRAKESGERGVELNTGEQYAAAEALERGGEVTISNVDGRRYAFSNKDAENPGVRPN